MELTDRVAVVTGASRGIGFAVAHALGREGCRLAICSRTRDELEGAAERLAGSGSEVLAMPADVAVEEDVERLAQRVREEMGGADILVNNAGITRFGAIDELTARDLDEVLATNVRGPFLCARAFLPGMLEREDGVIVNIASLAGKNFFAGGAAYVASKHALVGLSKSMMLDLRSRGVRVLTVLPGSVDTAFFDTQDRFDPDRDRILRPETVAEAVVEAVRLSDRGTVSEIEVRPVNP
ncbi:MAG: SDR family NAD(P)-dependent oxidoreductase [Candidatus Palauibacterales bacterium]|nr:SDR family NAD(P)-dependent oxidoreductase [Candidatus Palauibacterales bacterium]MDP2528548.1 SDR family NAD(P)-dependent oxidoreductase [Candidatus Palauibacterales bacterium]MDP2584778.1 SDR family NAD(P)-dependent oxidoreductase [Candidatus Palauibacterales bacterium]